MSEIQPGGAEGEKYVKASVKVAADSSEKYSDIQEALDELA